MILTRRFERGHVVNHYRIEGKLYSRMVRSLRRVPTMRLQLHTFYSGIRVSSAEYFPYIASVKKKSLGQYGRCGGHTPIGIQLYLPLSKYDAQQQLIRLPTLQHCVFGSASAGAD